MEVQLVVASGSKAGQVIPITGSKFIIGRADDCNLKPRSELISRYHCAVISEEGYVAIRDLGSKNGVYLNGERVPLEGELKNGDKLSVGPLEFVVNLSVGMKGAKKSKVQSIEQVVARTVEIGEAAAKASAEAVVEEVVSPVAEKAVVVKKSVQKPVQAAVKAVVQPTVAKIEEVEEVIEEEEEEESSTGTNIADWLLGSGESEQNQETRTVEVTRVPSAGVYVPDDDPVEEDKDTDGEKSKTDTASKFAPKKAASGRDAAANLLKNFFKGGR